MPDPDLPYDFTRRDGAVPVLDYDEPAIVTDATGRYIAVSGALGTFLVEDSGAELTQLRAITAFGEPVLPPDIVSLGGGRFAIEQRLGIALVDARTPSAAPRLWKPFPATFYRSLALAPAGPGEFAVAVADEGYVRFWTIPSADQPLVPESFVQSSVPLPIDNEPYVTAVAVTERGDRVAIAGLSRVIVSDRDPDVGSLASITEPLLTGLSMRGRTFLVAADDALITLSAHTGSELARLQANGDWTAPVVGPRTCVGDVTPQTYVETVSRHLGLARTFDATTLASVNCGALEVPTPGRVIESIRLPGADVRVTLARTPLGGGVVVRQGTGGEVTGSLYVPTFVETCPTEEGSLDSCRPLQQLFLSPTGDRLALMWHDWSSEVGDYSGLLILDPLADWGVGNAPTPYEYPLIPHSFAITRDRVVLNDQGLFAVDPGLLAEGRPRIAWIAEDDTFSTTHGLVVTGDALSGDRLFAYRGGDDKRAYLLDMKDGATLDTYFGVLSGGALYPTPNRQRAFWWRRRAGLLSEYGMLRFHPDGSFAGSSVIDALPVDVNSVERPPGAGGLYMGFTPDGVRGFIGGTAVDELLVVE